MTALNLLLFLLKLLYNLNDLFLTDSEDFETVVFLEK